MLKHVFLIKKLVLIDELFLVKMHICDEYDDDDFYNDDAF